MRRSREHGRELVRHTRLANSFSRDISGQPKLLQPQRALIHAVETNLLMFVAGKTEHLNRQRFYGTQQFAAALQNQRGIGPGKFDQNLRPFPIAPLGKRRIDGYAVFEMETAVRNDTAQERVDFLCG